jgi:pancreatic triacylglycerol lipase
VIALDLPYFTARLRCKEIGNYIGEMVTTITENTSQSNDDIHIIGFSMGAHIAGYAGKRLGGKVHRITGMY